MTSYGLIFKFCIAAWVLALFGAITNTVALAMTVSWVVLDFLGVFKREKAYIAERLQQSMDEDYEPEQESRAEEFKRKLREAQESQPDATITMIDPDGNKSSIVLKASGEVITEGNPDPEIVEAARNLAGAIRIFGTEAIAQEMEQYIKAHNDEQLRQQAEELKRQLRNEDKDD